MASTGTGMSFFLFSILLVVRFSQVHCFGEKVRSASPARSCSPPSGTGKCSLTEGQSLLQLQRLNGGTSLEKAQQRAEIEEPEWEAVNGGTDQACRGAKPSDNSADYYTLHPGTKSVDACQALCLEDSVSCIGVEYSAAGGRCELWTRPGGIAASATVSGYTCLRLIYAAEFSLVDGGENRACRGADSLDNSNSYYLLRFGLGSIDACKQACARELSCKGIEYHLAGGGRCELWTRDRGIEASIRNEGYNCLSFVRTDGATALPSQPPAEPSCKPFAEWPDVDKVTCSGCRALVLTAPYGGRCDSYCGSFGQLCLAAAEEVNENCAVKYTARCDEQIAGTSDMLCTCGYAELPSSSTTPPSTASSSTSSAPAATETTTQATTTPIRVKSTLPSQPPAEPSCKPFAEWPDVDKVTCSGCRALVLTAPYGGRCDSYCGSFGHVCLAAAEEVNENCAVKYTARCDEQIAGTSDMLCTCGYAELPSSSTTPPSTASSSTSSAPAATETTTQATTTPIRVTSTSPPADPSDPSGSCCSPFSLWPQVDNGITCDSCTALVLTESYGGRCDQYCESFGHVCVAAAEEEDENCAVKYVAECDVVIAGTSDMLCTCHLPRATGSCLPETSALPTSTTPAPPTSTTPAPPTTTTPAPPTSTTPVSPRSRIEVRGRQLLVDGKPLHLKGVAWNPIPKGGRHPANLDFAGNVERDAEMMQQAGINAVRTYEPITERAVLDALWVRGIWVVNSVYSWGKAPPDSVIKIVDAVKDHPAILMWTIGNEWNYNGLYVGMNRAQCLARIGEIARLVRQADSAHPIASIYGGLGQLDDAIARLPEIDVWAINSYRGLSFGNLFNTYASLSGKPMFFGEYGADAWNANIGREDEQSQADATTALTQEIMAASAVREAGVCLGGFVFEFCDEWWKDGGGSPSVHDTGGIAPGGGPHPDKTFNEEWWGLVNLDRSPRLAFQAYKAISLPGPQGSPGLQVLQG
ncbi:unnamed protein product [Polarella glacialis]|uniref:Apple domain-containing protein n=1 Tax=Polarella glacialis TaxID=89957 RepID=A0A813DSE9_POLGL|nr:unnamed protein product [Polarella glacialis]